MTTDDLPEAFRPKVNYQAPDWGAHMQRAMGWVDGYNAALEATNAAEWRECALKAEAEVERQQDLYYEMKARAMDAEARAIRAEAALQVMMEEHGALRGNPGSDSPAEAIARAALAQAKGADA